MEIRTSKFRMGKKARERQLKCILWKPKWKNGIDKRSFLPWTRMFDEAGGWR
jgi:hypothetical protein